MFRLKITVMVIFTEIYSFRLNIVRDTNVVQDTKCRTGHKMSYGPIFHPIFMGNRLRS